MEDVFDKEENAKNIYVIKHKLGGLTKGPREDHFEWEIGHFMVKIYPREMQGLESQYLTIPTKVAKRSSNDSILKYQVVGVHVAEFFPQSASIYVNLNQDPRFKYFTPIQYDVGRGMPILQLCELIRYLYRLSNLTAFL